MQTDIDAVKDCIASYDPASKWDYWGDGSDTNGVKFGILGNTITFPGSETPEDWRRDFTAIPCMPFQHLDFGLIHLGFWIGMQAVYDKTSHLLGNSPLIRGHSLGGGRSWLYAGLLISAGRMPGRIATIGSPKPGCEQLRSLLAPCSKVSFRNGLDPVPLLPVWEPALPIEDPCDLTLIDVAPPVPIDIFAWHHPAYYLQGVETLNG